MADTPENVNNTALNTAQKPKTGKTLPPAMRKFCYTPETAKEASQRAAYCRSLRAQMRKRLLEVAVSSGIDTIFEKALKSGDIDQINLVREGMKLVGLDYGSSEEAVQRIDAKLDAKTDNKVEVVVKGLDG